MPTIQTTLANPDIVDNTSWKGAKLKPCLVIFALASVMWMCPTPSGLDIKAWHLFIIFISTIVAVIAKPLPIGSLAIVAMAACVSTHTLT